jgi:hypothetical protein
VSRPEPVGDDQTDQGRRRPRQERVRDARVVNGSRAARPNNVADRASTDTERVGGVRPESARTSGPASAPSSAPDAVVGSRNDQAKRGAASMAEGRKTDTHNSRREKPRTAAADETEQLLVTLSAATGEIVKVEKLDPGGKRHELSDGEYAALAVDDETDEIEAALEEAYAAGVGDALGEDDEDGADDEEDALRRLAVGRLLVRGMLRRGLRRRLIRRAIQRDDRKQGSAPRGKERL